ncbi:winged helix-turn-helix domain-containing protein [Aestuariicoccus sp. MJ-SS9]|uniref:ArsR/SmtB family transcription factor n=1 Tax=Aestuariicoccus sp. MJ-SS9 TaxID=3079855 RepID=UPI002930023D|nr:winged helix-turn-helix domain-containing protein [Aestuariicoccus sp. MJ-SS9]
MTKALFKEMADPARAPEYVCWRSKMELAARMGTDKKVVSRHLAKLEAAGLIQPVGERVINGSNVLVWTVNLEAIFALPPARAGRNRTDLIDKIKAESDGKAPGTENQPPGVLRATPHGNESLPILNEPKVEPQRFAENESSRYDSLYARKDDDRSAEIQAWADKIASDPEKLAKAHADEGQTERSVVHLSAHRR